jgi:hypothetical protein
MNSVLGQGKLLVLEMLVKVGGTRERNWYCMNAL